MSRVLIVLSLLGCLLLHRVGWAVPSTTLSITPSAVSGTTITASDENTRNANTTTWANAHTHTDIANTADTLNIGNNTAGNKNICSDATTDRCLRWDDTNNLWLVQQAGTTYNEILAASGTAGLTSGGLLYGNGTAAPYAGSNAGADDQVPVADSATASTWRTLPNCTDSSGNHLNYTQSSNSFSCGTSSSTSASVGRAVRTAGDDTTTSTSFVDLTTMSVTMTTGANRALIGFVGTCRSDTAQAYVLMDVDIDGARQGTAAGVGIEPRIGASTEEYSCGFVHLTNAALTAASHTFKIQWRTTSGTAAMRGGSGSPAEQYEMWVIELK